METKIYFTVARREILIGALDDQLFKPIKVPSMTVTIAPDAESPYMVLTIPGRKARARFLPGGAVGVIPYRHRHHVVVFQEKTVAMIIHPDGNQEKNWFLCPDCDSLDTFLDHAIPILGTNSCYWNMRCRTCNREWRAEHTHTTLFSFS